MFLQKINCNCKKMAKSQKKDVLNTKQNKEILDSVTKLPSLGKKLGKTIHVTNCITSSKCAPAVEQKIHLVREQHSFMVC